MYEYSDFNNFKQKGIIQTDSFDVWRLKTNGLIKRLDLLGNTVAFSVDDNGNISASKNFSVNGSLTSSSDINADSINEVSVDTASIANKSILRYSSADSAWVAGDSIPKSPRKVYRGTSFVMGDSFSYIGLSNSTICANKVGVIVKSDQGEDVDIVVIANFNIIDNTTSNTTTRLVDVSVSGTQGTEVSSNVTNIPFLMKGSFSSNLSRSGKKRVVANFTLKNQNDNGNSLNIVFGPSGITGTTGVSNIRTNASAGSWTTVTNRDGGGWETAMKVMILANRPVSFQLAPLS